MSNITVPTKNTGDQHTAAELNQQTGWINSPSKALGVFNPAAIVLDDSGSYTDYAVTGNISLIFTGTPVNGNWHKVRMTGFNGVHTLTAPTNSVILNSSFTSGSAIPLGTYDLWIAYVNGEYLINLVSVSVVVGDVTAPTVQTATVENADPDALIVVFDEPVNITNVTGLSLDGSWAGTTISASGSAFSTVAV